MLISCPKCNAVYQVSENKLPERGKRFKCAECGKIWTVHNEDLKNMEPENTQQQVKSQMVRPADSYEQNAVELENMFNRVSKDTNKLFVIPSDSIEGSWENRSSGKKISFSPRVINLLLIILIIVLTGVIAVTRRYQIVEAVPQLETVYSKLGLESVYKGRDISFKNMAIKPIEIDGIIFTEVSGIIYNHGTMNSKIPTIKAVMTDVEGRIISEAYKQMALTHLAPKYSAIFRILLENQTTDAKRITLTFDNNYTAEN